MNFSNGIFVVFFCGRQFLISFIYINESYIHYDRTKVSKIYAPIHLHFQSILPATDPAIYYC